MKILIIMDPGILVPPEGYGGIERLVEVFAKEYTRMGNEVHLLVTTGSHVEGCTMHPFGKEGFPPKRSDALLALPVAWKFLWKHRNDFDLVHNFGRLAYLLPLVNHPIKKIMTYQREISNRNNRLLHYLPIKNMVCTACSANLLSRLDNRGTWEVVYNAIEFKKYDLQEKPEPDAPLMFLGRIEKIKGCHTAIQVAKKTGNKLIIAGNISPLPEEKAYFEKEIKPFIDDKQIIYVGALNDEQKNHWLGRSKAMLFPIEWNEPFGIVMIEAMACGTPVIGFNRGSVNEVVEEGITGFKVDTVEQMINAVEKLDGFNRESCRIASEKRFDVKVIAARYLQIISSSRKKIVIITTSQPAANPRALKEYSALIEAGYRVKFLYTYSAKWSYDIDEEKFKKGELKKQDFVLVGGNPFNRRFHYFVSRFLYRIFRRAITIMPSSFFRKMTTARTAFYFWSVAGRFKADLYIAHYLGALPAAMKAAKKYKAPVIFDAEDFHRGEKPYYPAQTKNVIAVENELLPKVHAITTASPLISETYKNLYPAQNISTINNVFSAKYAGSLKENNNRKLRLFWFSQNVAVSRGLEIFITALNYLPGYDLDLTIMGTNRSLAYKEQLRSMADDQQRIIFREPMPPEEIFSFAQQFDIGLAGEIPNCINKEVCLSNKLFTYLLSGNCVLSSDTTAQKRFMELYPGIGLLYKYNDPEDLSRQIKLFYDDRQFLTSCKRNALQLAIGTMNWENEKEKFLRIVNTLIEA